jgi:predicted CXXCH cytochrome family protein
VWPGVLAICLTILLCIGLASGCSTTTRHETLNFFFTGVPPLEGETVPTDPGAQDTAQFQSAALAKQKRMALAREPQFWVHGPYGAAECDRCHALAASAPFRARLASTEKAVSTGHKPIANRLSAPVEELCVSCHDTHEAANQPGSTLVFHTPLVTGMCNACHNPHQSRRRYMLREENNFALCTQCHDADRLKKAEYHQSAPEANCTECHNPHMGKTRMMLRVDFDESINRY